MTLFERCLLIAAARDMNDMEYISGLSDQEKDSLGGDMGFVRVEGEVDG